MPSRNLWTLCLYVVLVFTTSLSLYGQSTFGTVDGSVADSSGAAVAGAQVTLTNTGTQEKRVQSTGNEGLYQFVNVIPGQYRLDVEKAGFKHFTRNDVTVEVNQDSHLNATLPVGQVTETVEVTAETPLLQAETASLGQVVEERKANELPLNGRNIFNLITISPAAVAQGGSGGTPVGQNPFSWGNYQVGGSFGNQSAEYLDGQPLNIGYINLPVIIPTQDSVGEFKVQYNNLGPEFGKFSGGIMNFSTKSGTNAFHGEAYEFLRNKIFNSNDYFIKQSQLLAGQSNETAPYVQNQYGFNVGGPIIKDKTFFFVSWEQFRQRFGNPITTTIPTAAFEAGNFSSLLPSIQLYDPYTVNPATGARTAYAGNMIPSSEFSPAALALWNKYYAPVQSANNFSVGNYIAATSAGGNNTQFVARGDQNITDKTRLFARFTYFGLLDLPTNPFNTGLCNDRCAEDYHTKALAIDFNHVFSPNVVGDLNISGSRFIYLRAPLLAGYDLTGLGWPASYNSEVPAIMRTPPTPAFPFPGDVGKSQGNSAIGDHNTQYNVSPSLTVIRGKHTLQFGAQWELGLDNYYQTNIASGAFGFSGAWTANIGGPNCTAANGCTSGFPFADFLLGLAQSGPASVVNQTEGAAQVPAQTAGRQTYRAFYGADTWHVTQKLTLDLGLRYELPGTWSDRYNRLSYWDPTVTNATVTGCNGNAGSPCIGDALLVGNGPNSSRNNLPLDLHEFSPRLGFAYSWDQKTVIRGGYGIFWIPNYISFGLNPDNDVINLATTPFFATLDHGITPVATLDESGCTFTAGAPGTLTGCTPGPFVNGILPPPGRTSYPAATPNISSFVASNGDPTLAPYTDPKYGYVQQFNLDIQRQLGAGFFVDVAYAGAHGVHLQQYSTNINQIPDSYVAQAEAQSLAGQPVAIDQSIPNPMISPNPSIGNGATQSPTILAGQLLRPYPQYTGLSLGGYGCCGSTYNSLQATVTRRFQGGGTLLVAYTNAKLLSNTDTLTSWLEGGNETGGVGSVQDYNNLNGERSLSSQDVSQRLVISYVLDLPFGHGKTWLNGASGVEDKVVSGWGIDGVTTFQRGFPLKITWAGPSTPLEGAGLGIGNIRPDVVAGCNKGGSRSLTEWFNVNCFAAPPAWGYGTESRVDSSLRAAGINNFDFAIFKRTSITERVGVEFRTEFFNLFNHPQFAPPGTGFNGTYTGTGDNGFGEVTSTNGDSNPRLIQFALKLIF